MVIERARLKFNVTGKRRKLFILCLLVLPIGNQMMTSFIPIDNKPIFSQGPNSDKGFDGGIKVN